MNPLIILGLTIAGFWVLIGFLAILIVIGAARFTKQIDGIYYLDGPSFGGDYLAVTPSECSLPEESDTWTAEEWASYYRESRLLALGGSAGNVRERSSPPNDNLTNGGTYTQQPA